MLPTWIEYTLTYYSLWGFLPGASTKFVKSCLTRSIIFIFHLFLSIWCTYHTIKTLEYQKDIMNFLDALNFALYCALSSILMWSILYDSLISRCNQHGFWQSFTQINESSYIQKQIKKLEYFLTLFMLLVGGFFIFYLSCASETCNYSHLLHLIFFHILDNRMSSISFI